MDDYLNSMVSKFRTKAKSVFKRSAALTSREMSAEDVNANSEKIIQLYESVLENADFTFGELNGTSFVNFKKHLADKFIFKGGGLLDTGVDPGNIHLNNPSELPDFLQGDNINALYAMPADFETSEPASIYASQAVLKFDIFIF